MGKGPELGPRGLRLRLGAGWRLGSRGGRGLVAAEVQLRGGRGLEGGGWRGDRLLLPRATVDILRRVLTPRNTKPQVKPSKTFQNHTLTGSKSEANDDEYSEIIYRTSKVRGRNSEGSGSKAPSAGGSGGIHRPSSGACSAPYPYPSCPLGVSASVSGAAAEGSVHFGVFIPGATPEKGPPRASSCVVYIVVLRVGESRGKKHTRQDQSTLRVHAVVPERKSSESAAARRS